MWPNLHCFVTKASNHYIKYQYYNYIHTLLYLEGWICSNSFISRQKNSYSVIFLQNMSSGNTQNSFVLQNWCFFILNVLVPSTGVWASNLGSFFVPPHIADVGLRRRTSVMRWNILFVCHAWLIIMVWFIFYPCLR